VPGVRALLVVNPNATTTTAAGKDVLARALASELKLEVFETTHRGHAAVAAEHAALDGVELIVVHGGDGTVNEVVNGMLAGTGGPRPDPDDGPAVAVVPGGSANVLARALGLPRDPLEATATILEALAARRSRLIGLGRADSLAAHSAGAPHGDDTRSAGAPHGRWFTFNAGMGWDAEVVAEVERARAAGREATPQRYARTALRHYLRQRRRPRSMTVEVPGAEPVPDVRMAFVCNTDTWTYLGSRPVRTNPGASFGTGLGLFGLSDLGAGTVGAALRQMLITGGDPRGRNVLRHDAVPLLTVRSAEPIALQLDGDHLGERREVRFRAVSDALRVVV
jgi:diacylglycerol kinase family enzyme